MQVRECMTTNGKACVPEDSCAVAGEIMRRRQCGFLPVVDNLTTKRVTGVVTDHAMMLQMVSLDLPASEVAVKACMTASPTMISAEADLEVAVGVMKKEALYRLPVIDDGRLVGVLSLEDVALAVHRQWAYVGAQINEQRVTEILEAIAVAREPRHGGPRRGESWRGKWPRLGGFHNGGRSNGSAIIKRGRS